MKEKISIIAKGFCMGMADVIPGVSGGTMAFILGIYQRLLAAINSFNIEWLQLLLKRDIKGFISYPHLAFLIPLFLGIFAALMFFTRVIPLPKLIETDPELIYGLFFGLILGSIIVLLGQLDKLGVKDYLIILIGAIAGFLIVTLTPTNTPESFWFIFFCGSVAITAMILPGISGSFILLILGKYAYVINALSEFNFAVIIPFALGAAAGLALFSRLLNWLMINFHHLTLLIINGVLMGSLWVIWPFQNRIYIEVREKQRLIESNPVLPETWEPVVITSVAMMITGLIFVLLIDHFARLKSSSR